MRSDVLVLLAGASLSSSTLFGVARPTYPSPKDAALAMDKAKLPTTLPPIAEGDEEGRARRGRMLGNFYAQVHDKILVNAGKNPIWLKPLVNGHVPWDEEEARLDANTEKAIKNLRKDGDMRSLSEEDRQHMNNVIRGDMTTDHRVKRLQSASFKAFMAEGPSKKRRKSKKKQHEKEREFLGIGLGLPRSPETAHRWDQLRDEDKRAEEHGYSME